METERLTGAQLDHQFRILFLGDHNVGKAAFLTKARQRNPAAGRGRRHSLPVRNLTFEMYLKRGGKSVSLKVMDTGGKLP